VFVKFGSNIDCGGLDGLEEHFYSSRCQVERERENEDGNIPATPGCSTSTRWGWNMHSGASYRSEPTLITRPSGSCPGCH
jgi:hypothetical protein